MTIARWRFLSQVFFSFLVLWIGVEFHLWLWAVEQGRVPPVARPPGVEAFLPISSLMNLVHWFHAGSVHPFHPAGVVIFVATLAMSWFVAKAFCGWICPIGFLSEMVWWARARLLPGRGEIRWKPLDRILQLPKYLLLGAFVWAIFGAMSPADIAAFLDSPYNLVADAKMSDFFVNLSYVGMGVIAFLVIISFLVRNAWCRFLCPFGALLGLVGLLSPIRVRRQPEACISCGKCTAACPNAIAVHRARRVCSDNCFSCLGCVQACPVPGALAAGKRSRSLLWPAVAVGAFLAILGLGMAVGLWDNDIPAEVYAQHLRERGSYGHPGR